MSTPAAERTAPRPDFAAPRRHFIFTDEHEQLRESTFPDSVFARMGALGLLGLDKPEAYGGRGGDYFSAIVLGEEMAGAHCGGLAMGVAVQTDTALLAFSDVRVPDSARLGELGKGFYNIMWELQGERLIAAAGCNAGAQLCFDRTLRYAGEREAFGRPIGRFQASATSSPNSP